MTARLAWPSLLALVVLLLVGRPAAAYPDARLDEQIKPNFGVLLRPPVRHGRYDACAYRHSCPGGSYRDGRYSYSGGYYDGGYEGQYGGQAYGSGYTDAYGTSAYYRAQDAITVDCADPRNGAAPIARALAQLNSGGTLFIKAHGAACNETIIVTRPVTIIGDGVPAFATGPNTMPATLAPPPDSPCLVIDHAKGVEIRDLILESRTGRDRACIESFESDVALTRTVVRYQGNASAIYADGGRVVLRDSDIDAKTFDPAVAADGVELTVSDTTIRGEAVGIDINLGGQTLSHISNVGVLGARDGDPTTRPEVGIMVHGAREGSQKLDIARVTISGWRTGLWVGRGATVTMKDSRIARAGTGVISDGDLELGQTLISASDTGVYISGGHARLTGSVMTGFSRTPIQVESYAVLEENDDWVFASDCSYYRGGRRTCRERRQAPYDWSDDRIGESGPWGWVDTSYRGIGEPYHPPARRGLFGGARR